MNKIVSYLVKVRKIDITKEKLISLAKSQMKKTVEVDGDRIRATFGHSIILNMNVPESFQPCTKVPKHLYALVDTRSMFVASKNGLFQNVLLTDLSDSETTLTPKQNSTLAIINSEKASRENVSFYVNNNNKYYITFVPSKFVSFKIK
jgi:RNA:NAD 2'-phosphotransferase (TPT1/KptA family)